MLFSTCKGDPRCIRGNVKPLKMGKREGSWLLCCCYVDETSIFSSIGYSIAKRLAQEGAKVMVSSRKESNVSKAVMSLKEEKGVVDGVVCHVGKDEDRKRLIAEVREGGSGGGKELVGR